MYLVRTLGPTTESERARNGIRVACSSHQIIEHRSKSKISSRSPSTRFECSPKMRSAQATRAIRRSTWSHCESVSESAWWVLESFEMFMDLLRMATKSSTKGVSYAFQSGIRSHSNHLKAIWKRSKPSKASKASKELQRTLRGLETPRSIVSHGSAWSPKLAILEHCFKTF